MWMTDNFAMYNYEATIGFASLAIIIMGITVIWTGYQNRLRWTWFIMFVFVCVYYIPVYLLDFILELRKVGWPDWSKLLREAIEGRPISRATAVYLATLTLMVVALLLPIRTFFGKKSVLSPGDK